MGANRQPRAGSIALQWLLKALRVGVLAYLGTILVLLFLENRLIYPAPRFPAGDWKADHLPHEDVFFASSDGTKLHGWFVEHPRPRAVVLYCHGNGEHVAYNDGFLAMMRDELGVSIFAFDYRGYGRSEGQPFETGILADSEAALAWVAARTGLEPSDVVLMGRSIGGGVAVHLAARHHVRGLILESTFSTLPDVAAEKFPWLPVRWLMQNRYDSLAKIADYDGPLLQSHGDCDELVSIELGKRLFDAARGPKDFYCVAGGDHNCSQPREYYQKLSAFLDSLKASHAADLDAE